VRSVGDSRDEQAIVKLAAYPIVEHRSDNNLALVVDVTDSSVLNDSVDRVRVWALNGPKGRGCLTSVGQLYGAENRPQATHESILKQILRAASLSTSRRFSRARRCGIPATKGARIVCSRLARPGDKRNSLNPPGGFLPQIFSGSRQGAMAESTNFNLDL